jgi:hypothetical protein
LARWVCFFELGQAYNTFNTLQHRTAAFKVQGSKFKVMEAIHGSIGGIPEDSAFGRAMKS